MPQSSEKTVYTVLFQDESRGPGPAGDCSHTYRSTVRRNAEKYAEDKEYYGKPATVMDDVVPMSVYRRWLREGKVAS